MPYFENYTKQTDLQKIKNKITFMKEAGNKRRG